MRSLFVAVIAAAFAAGGHVGGPRSTRDPVPVRGRAASTLSVAQLAGERVIASYEGLAPPASLITQIKRGQVAGVVFFADNIASRSQLKGVIAQLQRAAAASPVKLPLLMMTDQEGGDVRRLPGAPALSEKQIGEASDAAASAAAAGQGAGANLRGAGLNINLAPVLDVFRKPGNFIDRFGRSYSSSARTVAKLGAAFISAQQRTGVAATAKHFPGLGAATVDQDTDAGPVTLKLSLAIVRGTDELPYKNAIAAGVRLVMVSWAVYPALDAHHPAGLSPTVVGKELRGRLGFRGVTITDAIGAGGLRGWGGSGHRALLAAGAGMDLILCAGQNPAEAAAAYSDLAGALSSGRLARSAFVSSVNRVLALRRSMPSS